MADVSYWKCPECGAVISGERVVDKTFPQRVADHREDHATNVAEPWRQKRAAVTSRT